MKFDDYVGHAEKRAYIRLTVKCFSSLDMGNDCKQDRPTAYNLHYQETDFVFAKRRFYAGLLTFSFILAGLTNVQAASPTGRWSGGWYSQSTGHKGPLKAKIRQTQPGTYQAVFFGRFAKVIPFVYPAKLERVPGTCNCYTCLLYTSPSPRDLSTSRMPSSA